MKKRIGFFASELEDIYPRGVTRVARSFAENLVDMKNLECICLVERLNNQFEVTYQVQDLKEWLLINPMQIISLKGKIKWFARKFLNRALPPFLLPSIKDLFRLIAKIKYKIKQNQNSSSNLLKCNNIVIADLDFILVFEPFNNFWDLSIQDLPVKLIGWFHDAIPLRINEGKYWNPDKFSSAINQLVLKANIIVCVSKSSESDLNFYFPSSRDKSCTIHLGNDANRFQNTYDQSEIDNTLIKYKINNNINYFVFIGTLEIRKNIINILRACIYLGRLKKDLNFQVVLIGDLFHAKTINWLLREANKYFKIICTGYISDRETNIILSNSIGLLYPSLWEGFGFPPLEAMSAGVIPIVADLSSLPEVCGDHAFYCDPYDVSSIAESMQRCLAMTAEERNTRITEARLYSSQFTWQKAVTELTNILNN
jgi:glycosyltransferase involved in cell wall biosynthesis